MVSEMYDQIVKNPNIISSSNLINQIDLNGKNDELLNELVKLSKDYGILTPYTAFLAREEMDFSSVRNIFLSIFS